MSRLYLVLAGALITGGLLWWVYSLGNEAGENRARNQCQQQQAIDQRAREEAEAKALRSHREIMSAAVAAERAYWQGQAQAETYYNEIEREVIRYVERTPSTPDCGLDADGLRLWQAANRGPSPAAASEGH